MLLVKRKFVYCEISTNLLIDRTRKHGVEKNQTYRKSFYLRHCAETVQLLRLLILVPEKKPAMKIIAYKDCYRILFSTTCLQCGGTHCRILFTVQFENQTFDVKEQDMTFRV